MGEKLQIRSHSFSIVVLAEQNNPSIFNPDFLKDQGIIEHDWILSDIVICTPQLANFGYKNGVKFTFDLQSLVIMDVAPEGGDFPIPDVAIRFLKSVPLVKYHSLGINFEKMAIFSSLEEAKRFTYERFLNEKILKMPYTLDTFTPTFSLKLADSVCNLAFQAPLPGKLGEENIFGVVFKGNFHREFKHITNSKERNEAIIQTLVNWKTDQMSFDEIVKHYLED